MSNQTQKLDATKLIEILKDKHNRGAQIESLSYFILDGRDAKKPDKALSGAEIFNEYEGLRQENATLPQIPQNTFTIYLSKIAESEESKINCQGRRQGYYIDLVYEKIDEQSKVEQNKQESIEVALEGKKTHILEKDTYPWLENWLFQCDNERVADISSLRAQGKWSNPDLVGMKTDNLFGATDVEITTIEAKITYDNWEQWIFESIAHTVFSNRSYFAFIFSEEHIHKLPADMKHYAEIFKVGILIIAINATDYIKVQKKEKFELRAENHRIIEYVPAPYHTPHLKFKKRFLQGLGITEPKHLYQFGRELDK